ncbi:MAG: tripartite tricarboxylate transporter TctB family protein [Desulfarculus sp.]|nr:tripartite tricarboxylate transporter TctB family protein [Pseudomonadota bacterium]MBV1717621.1 tripartite tricarboxylate transporter TctB family protein [Desulfarculus sp.]MBU4576481.1 tripartite tricarboxylate transporter TctB family protein [Pseudomonadota bacterium]MBU4599162.1 tripartite tricarboxylate transporter TctB family protein [Pseudomonadota bacterium]MBV1739785.1 tripartite tricarboxylate transporter TctB family protein [Desulfarculus sp.]
MNARSELSIATVLIGFSMLNYFYLIPTQVVAEGSSPVYPALINTMLLCFSLAYLGEGVRSWRKQRQAQSEGTGGGKKLMVRPLAMLVVTGAWVLSMEQLGFIISTFAFLMIASRIFGSKSWGKTLILSVAMPLIIYFVFRGLNALLPEGPAEELINLILG